MHDTLLQLRGRRPAAVPHRDQASGSVLLFNGEVLGGMDVPAGENDAALLLQALTAAGSDVPAVLRSLQGPWALVFWDATAAVLWFGRDYVGTSKAGGTPEGRAGECEPRVGMWMRGHRDRGCGKSMPTKTAQSFLAAPHSPFLLPFLPKADGACCSTCLWGRAGAWTLRRCPCC